MENTEKKQKGSIGSSTLILIFIILCLATFALLSLSNAGGDRNLANKNAEAVRTYYEADSQGERFVQMVDQAVQEVRKETSDQVKQHQMLAEKLGNYYNADNRTAETDIPMDFDQALHMELALDSQEHYVIRSWRVYNQKDYEIDSKMPVWDGGSQ